MRIGERNSVLLLNTNIDVFGEIPEEITSLEISKLLRRFLTIRNRDIIVLAGGADELLNDLFLGLVIDPNIGCWYIKERPDKYRQLRINKLKFVAHRLAYKLFIGPIKLPEICHHCDRCGCNNPWHLFNGTHADNVEDAKLKGRLHKPKSLTATEKFLLWKHINSPNIQWPEREAVSKPKTTEIYLGKINI